MVISQAFGQGAGDLSFIAFNADGDDGFAMVTFIDLQPNTNILFRDEEWGGTAFVGTGEGQAEWNTGTELIPAGTVILFSDISAAAPSVSHGSLTNTDMGLSATSEGIFCFLGTDTQTPTTFICAVGNADAATAFGTLDGTGLVAGSTAITYASGIDVAEYVGPRTGLDVDGYRQALNLADNYLTQDGSGDQHNDGVQPDVPFDATPFVISSEDLTPPAPISATVVSSTQVAVIFSESVVNATELANYSFDPALTINTISYDSPSNTALISHSGFATAQAYALTVSSIEDANGNVQTAPQTFSDLLVNDQQPNLRITEIMYNPPGGANDLEFIEIWNFEETAIELGGFVCRDGGSFNFVLPTLSLAPNTALLLASNADTAAAFYGVAFLDIPGNGNLLGNGGESITLTNSLGEVIDEVTYDDASPWPTAADGDGPSLELLSPSLDQNMGTSWTAASQVQGQIEGTDVLASPGAYTTITAATISFADDHSDFQENTGLVGIALQIIGNAGLGNFELSVEAGDAALGTDFTLPITRVDFDTLASGDLVYNLEIGILDNALPQNDRWFSLVLSSETATIGSNNRHIVYINDTDKLAPVANQEIALEHLGSYLVEAGGSAEIVAYDPLSVRLFTVNSENNKLHLLDFSNPSALQEIAVVDMSTYGDGINSVAVFNSLVAVAVERDDTTGVVVFLDTDGNEQAILAAGYLPDHVAFTPDGAYVLTANEGEPNDDYTTDPEGSITIIDLREGLANATSQQANFLAFNEQIDQLRSSGVRIFGPGASVAQDMEPEYITFNSSGTIAYVTCQENNALAVVDIANATVEAILPLGYKDHSLAENALDASDRTDGINFVNWPIFGMYNPDAIASFNIAGQDYLITANEGDARDYDGYSEESSVGDVVLDAIVFPDAAVLQQNNVLGRLNITTANGDTDGDGEFEELYAFGARSFSIWNASTGALVWDSGDQLERITAADPVFGALFNASNGNNNFKNRSDNKGPEPESVAVAVIGDATYAFIGLERIGGVMTYDVSDPTAPVFVDYINTRTTEGSDEGGDLGPEGMIYIQPSDSPIDTGLLVVANEISATLAIFAIPGDVLSSLAEPQLAEQSLMVYPNPSVNGLVYFAQPIDYELFNLQGQLLRTATNAAYADLSQLPLGTYLLRSATGAVAKVLLAH